MKVITKLLIIFALGASFFTMQAAAPAGKSFTRTNATPHAKKTSDLTKDLELLSFSDALSDVPDNQENKNPNIGKKSGKAARQRHDVTDDFSDLCQAIKEGKLSKAAKLEEPKKSDDEIMNEWRLWCRNTQGADVVTQPMIIQVNGKAVDLNRKNAGSVTKDQPPQPCSDEFLLEFAGQGLNELFLDDLKSGRVYYAKKDFEEYKERLTRSTLQVAQRIASSSKDPHMQALGRDIYGLRLIQRLKAASGKLETYELLVHGNFDITKAELETIRNVAAQQPTVVKWCLFYSSHTRSLIAQDYFTVDKYAKCLVAFMSRGFTRALQEVLKSPQFLDSMLEHLDFVYAAFNRDGYDKRYATTWQILSNKAMDLGKRLDAACELWKDDINKNFYVAVHDDLTNYLEAFLNDPRFVSCLTDETIRKSHKGARSVIALCREVPNLPMQQVLVKLNNLLAQRTRLSAGSAVAGAAMASPAGSA